MDIILLNKLKKAQMEIMDEVHRICELNDIKYYIIGGTALGAKRHGGFIPWDLDIDIAMPRVDYEKFSTVCEKELSDRFSYKSFKKEKKYTKFHALVCINNTFLSTKYSHLNPKEVNKGIYIDVFPLDKAPLDKALQVKQGEKLRKIKKMKEFRHGYSYSSVFYKRFIKKSISRILFFISMDKLNEKYDRESQRYSDSDSGLLCSMASHYRYEKQCMPEEIYGVPQLVKFEDRMYYAPEKLEEYLTRIYGDYMKLPPQKEIDANISAFSDVVFDN